MEIFKNNSKSSTFLLINSVFFLIGLCSSEILIEKVKRSTNTDESKISCYIVSTPDKKLLAKQLKAKEICKPKMKDDEPSGADMEKFMKYYDDMEKSGYDDNCFSQCQFETMEMITPEGNIDVPGIIAVQLMSNGSAVGKEIVTKIWTDCGITVESKAKADGGMKTNSCKYASMLRLCAFLGHYKKRNELMAAC